MSNEVQPIGEVTHFFDRISVAVIRLSADVSVGDWVQFYGTHTQFVQQVESMQIEHQPVDSAPAGSEVAIQTISPARKGDGLYPYRGE
jgi:hypothetical protein